MRVGDAVMELSRIGFRIYLDGQKVKFRFEGELPREPAAVCPLLAFLREHEEEVSFFLKCYCPKCGGCCFIPDYEGKPLCMGCDWEELVSLYPGMAEAKD